MKEVFEFRRRRRGSGDESSALVRVEACQDGDLVELACSEGGDGGSFYEASWSVDHRLEGPADGGVVGIED